MKSLKIFFQIGLVSGGVLFFSACGFLGLASRSGIDPNAPRKFSEIVPSTTSRITKNVQLNEAKFHRSVELGVTLPSIRLVPVYRRSAEKEYGAVPEFRVFQVHPKGPFALMGLQEGDVLLAVHDFLIYQPERIQGYPRALLVDRESSIVLRRGADLIQLDVEIVKDPNGAKL